MNGFIKSTRTIAEWQPDEWDDLCLEADVNVTHNGLGLAERTANTTMQYLGYYLDDELIGGLPTAAATHESRWVFGRPDYLLEAAVAAGDQDAVKVMRSLGGKSESLLPSLITGGRHMGNSTLLSKSPNDTDISSALIDEAARIGRDRGLASISWPFVPASNEHLRTALEQHGYVSFESGRYSSLAVLKGGFLGYVAQFGKKKRWKIRNEHQSILDAGVVSRILPLGDCNLERLAELETQLLTKYGHTWDAAYTVFSLKLTIETFGPQALVSVSTLDDVACGFVILLQHGSQWFARQVGFDYEMQGHLPLYFETLFYSPAAHAEAYGIKRISYGLGSEQAKVSRGCLAESQFTYVLPLGID